MLNVSRTVSMEIMKEVKVFEYNWMGKWKQPQKPHELEEHKE